MDEKPVDWDMVFEEVEAPEKRKKKIGRLRSNGKVAMEILTDRNGRQLETAYFDDDEKLEKRVIYEHDEQRKPKLITVYNAAGKLIWRQERGKRPEDLSGS
jgi:hypothetical protein